MNASNYFEELILNTFFKNQSLTPPAQIFLALYKTNPTDADNGSEVDGGSYQRQLVTFGNVTQKVDRATVANAQRIEFDTATSAWGEVSYFGLRDQKNAGNLIAYGTFNKPTNIEEGNKFMIESGALTISVG